MVSISQTQHFLMGSCITLYLPLYCFCFVKCCTNRPNIVQNNLQIWLAPYFSAVLSHIQGLGFGRRASGEDLLWWCGRGHRNNYKILLLQVRRIMISRMAKPEEVLVVENDQGEVVREFMKDTDSINMYKNMRETLGKYTFVELLCYDWQQVN